MSLVPALVQELLKISLGGVVRIGLKCLQIRCSWFQIVISLGYHYSKINFVREKNADVRTKASLSLWQ